MSGAQVVADLLGGSLAFLPLLGALVVVLALLREVGR